MTIFLSLILCLATSLWEKSTPNVQSEAKSIPARCTITVQVENIKTRKGDIRVCLINSKDAFLKKCFLENSTKAIASKVELSFADLPKGTYAISVHHDKNGDGKVNQGLLGIPSEAYGFSNNPSTFFGPPDYEDCLLEVASNSKVIIRL